MKIKSLSISADYHLLDKCVSIIWERVILVKESLKVVELITVLSSIWLLKVLSISISPMIKNLISLLDLTYQTTLLMYVRVLIANKWATVCSTRLNNCQMLRISWPNTSEIIFPNYKRRSILIPHLDNCLIYSKDFLILIKIWLILLLLRWPRSQLEEISRLISWLDCWSYVMSVLIAELILEMLINMLLIRLRLLQIIR